ncbi:MAG: hypothetical protein JST89_15035 [Cyanobacteria bacterium SZAS-4]|nr:hypothetical protein [Cyanobacteria bacterium SZAS-4]
MNCMKFGNVLSSCLLLASFTASTASTVTCFAADEVSYRGVTFNTKTRLMRIPPNKGIRKRTPDNLFFVYDIVDHDRMIDQVMTINDKFSEWHQFKVIGSATVGDLYAHQQCSNRFPMRYPWIDFAISRSRLDGEKPTLVSAKALAHHPLECTYLIYVFRSGDVLQVAYDPKGVMGRCALLQPDGINSIFLGVKEEKENYSKYGIPETLSPDVKTVTPSSVMQTGLDKVDFLPLPKKAQLDHVFLVRQYDQARIFDVTTFDLKGKQLSNQICHFTARPMDEALAKKFKAGR